MKKSLINARGSSAIPLVPFLENGEIDYDAFDKQIDWICNCNVGSICGPVNVSEFMVLTKEERLQFVKHTVDVVGDRTCVIANVAAPTVKDAVEYTESFQKMGVDAVIAMPPYVSELDFNSVKEYYKTIAAATTLPVMVQNMNFTNIAISPDQVVEICEQAPNISWVKQEVIPAPVGVEQLCAKKSPAIEGIMTGFSGLYTMQDHANGAVATIHACEFCDLVQKVWDLLDAGKTAEARKLHAMITPALLMEGIYTWQYAKYIMEKRGIFKNHITRNKQNALTKNALREFDGIWEHIQTLY